MASSIARTATLFRKLLSGRRITYRELEDEENINRRTALRWIAEGRRVFGEALRDGTRASGEKEFWLDATGNKWIHGFKTQQPSPDEMAALDEVLRLLHAQNMQDQHARLTGLRSKLHGALEALREAPRADTDIQAITDAFGIASRPGPHVPVGRNVTAPLREAILRQHRVAFRYRARTGRETEKTAAPAGLLYGGAPRLVALEDGKEGLAQYRLDRMSEVTVLDEPHDPPGGRTPGLPPHPLRLLRRKTGERPMAVPPGRAGAREMGIPSDPEGAEEIRWFRGGHLHGGRTRRHGPPRDRLVGLDPGGETEGAQDGHPEDAARGARPAAL